MQSAQNTIYLQHDCRDFRDHPWACCGFIVSVSLTTALLYEGKGATTVASDYTVCLVTNTLTKVNKWIF